MNFKENYQDELENVSTSNALNQNVLKLATEKNAKINIRRKIPNFATAAILCIAIIVLIANHNNISAFAKSILSYFSLSIENEKVDFGEIETIAFDFKGNDEFYQTYESRSECISDTDLPLIDFSNANITDISILAIKEYGYINIVSSCIYTDYNFTLNGMATTTGFDQESWGFGTDEDIIEVYEYSNGKKAYILEYDDEPSTEEGVVIAESVYDAYIQVYFEENSILYQLTVSGDSEKDAIKSAKDLLDNIIR